MELQALYLALQALCKEKRNISIHLLIDNTTAVAYVREQGGSRSLECNKMAKKIWMWAYDRNIWLSSAHMLVGQMLRYLQHFIIKRV